MIRKMTKEEQQAHLDNMFKNVPTEALLEFKKGVEQELIKREMKKTEDLLEGKFVFVDKDALRIRQ